MLRIGLVDTTLVVLLFDEQIDQTEQVFDFITVPSFVSLYSESSIEPLYFIQVTGKGVAEEDISDPYGHFVAKDERYFQRLYLKLVRSRNAKVKRFLRFRLELPLHLTKFMTLTLILTMILN